MTVLRSFLAALIAMAPLAAKAQDVTPPQGYIAIDQPFSVAAPNYYDGTQTGFYNIDFPFIFHEFDAKTAKGTFWNNSFDFQSASIPDLPENYGSKIGTQNYLGLQVDDEGQGKVIFSVWWAEASEAGPKANCEAGSEIYYQGVSPPEGIPDLESVDTSRVWDGGTFHKCILNVSLQKGVPYTLRVWEIEEATTADAPEWWGAWLINNATKTEQFVGKIRVPGGFGWLAPIAGGFVEHYGAMPKGCASIPVANLSYSAARADAGRFESDTVSASVYGLCQDSVNKRITLDGCGASKTCTIKIKAAAKD